MTGLKETHDWMKALLASTEHSTVKLVGVAATNQNNVTTGKPSFKTGQRVLTFSAKFYF